ncbi:Serine/threonine-protein kinase STY46 [Pelomyxa schiedti]|nr:Serine/threonine-protein kinase STY46 [Pelomyxa schiedti]
MALRSHGILVVIAFSFLVACTSSQCSPTSSVPLLNVIATLNPVISSTAGEALPVIVDGGSAEPDFDISRVDLTPVAASGFQRSVTISWWFSNDTSSCNNSGSDASPNDVEFAGSFGYSSSWVLSAYSSLPPVAGLEVTMPDSGVIINTTTVTVTGLQQTGTSFAYSQETALSFDVGVECDADFIAAVEIHLAYAASYTGETSAASPPPSIASFAVRWQCAARGCLAWCGDWVEDCYDYCGDHGTCNHDAGTCICDSGWVGPFCGLVLETPETLCPNELLFLTYNIPPTIVGYPKALELLWTGLKVPSDLFYTEWHYFVTGSTATPDPSDPLIETGLVGSGYVLTPLRPAIYRLIVASDADTSRDYYIKYFVVKTWEECGFALCSDSGNNTCNSGQGWGTCKSGTCACAQGRFWNDCSRGCSKYSTVTSKSAQIQSDFPPSGLIEDMLYANSANCNWVIAPGDNTDVIVLNFTYVWIDPADTLSVYLVGPDGDTGDLITTVSTPLLLTVLKSSVIIQLRSDYEAASHGFVLTYTSKVNPLLDPKDSAIVIAVSAAVGTIIILSISISLSCYIIKQRKKKLREQQNAPAESLPAEEISQSIRRTLAEVNKDLKKVHMEVDRVTFNFGVTEGSTCEVLQNLKDEIILRNNGGQPVLYCFYVPRIEHKLEFNMCPGKGRIDPHREMKIEAVVKLLLTTRIESNMKLEITRGGDGISTLLPFRIEGMLSSRLDPDEIMLNHTPLAAGAFGSVFQGVYRSQLVAAKVLKHQEAFFENEFAEFDAECTLLKQLRHPNVVGFVGASYVTGKLCICTEFMDMGSLEKYLQSDQDILYALILKFALNTAEAMAYIHSNKILYRDLKCSNILLVSDDLEASVNCKLSDFGTSRSVEDPDEIIRRTSGKGTAIYMAPELLGHLPYNSKVDVFSFGVCLWEMWYRTEPWEELMCWDVPKTVMAGNRPPVDEDIPPEYSALMTQCWEQSAESRPDFKAVAATLASLYQAEKAQMDELRMQQQKEDRKNRKKNKKKHHKHGKDKDKKKGKEEKHKKGKAKKGSDSDDDDDDEAEAHTGPTASSSKADLKNAGEGTPVSDGEENSSRRRKTRKGKDKSDAESGAGSAEEKARGGSESGKSRNSSGNSKHHHRRKKARTRSDLRIVRVPSKVDLAGHKKSASKLDLNLDTSSFLRTASRTGNEGEGGIHKSSSKLEIADLIQKTPEIVSSFIGLKKSSSKPDLSSTPVLEDNTTGASAKKGNRRFQHRAALSNTVEMSTLKHYE